MAADGFATFQAAGSMQPAYLAVDWAATALGPVSGWSPALRATVDMMLHTRFPMAVFWGEQFVLVYNEGYTELIGDKHPSALGCTAPEVFPEAMDFIAPMMEAALVRGEDFRYDDAPVPLRRRGFLEECYFTFSYSPVRGADSAVEGVLVVAAETTEQVVSARRQELLGLLLERLFVVQDLDELAEQTCAVLGTDPDDLPVVDLHLPSGRTCSTAGAPELPTTPPSGAVGRRLVSASHDGTTTVWLPLQRPKEGRPDDGERPVSPAAGVMVVRCSERLVFDGAYRVFLRLVAGAVATVIGRLNTRAADLSLRERERAFSTALQRSLLTAPTRPHSLQVAVRYEPATDVAQVGGDWHDSFVLPDGALALSIGDVAGHDRDAAAGMAQVRNLLRGIAFTMEEPPAHVMQALDRAMAGLDVDTIATAILARVEHAEVPDAPDGQDGQEHLVLRWTNAGHPPPALITPDGVVELLAAEPDVLLGVVPDGTRADHVRVLEPGSTVVLYTDGLIDRRGHGLEHGFEWLARTLADHASEDPEQLADSLLAEKLSGSEDDVALLVLRVP